MCGGHANDSVHGEAPPRGGAPIGRDALSSYRPLGEPDPFGPRVDPLGEVLISELPDGFPGMFGLPIAPGLIWPVVTPDGLPAEGTPAADEPVEGEPLDTPPDVPPALPPAAPPPVCARAIELESAIAPVSASVANFMGRSLAVEWQ